MPNEEYALVLDYLPTGKSSSYKSEPLAQVMGITHFTLLEVIPKSPLKVMDKVYVGKEERQEIQFIKRRIDYKDLTSTAVSELDKAIEKVILEERQKFLDFFNKTGAITIRRHTLELLPGLGKKHMLDVLKERQAKPFESFEDLQKRVPLMPDPLKTLMHRVISELEGKDEKHYLFVRPPSKHDYHQRF